MFNDRSLQIHCERYFIYSRIANHLTHIFLFLEMRIVYFGTPFIYALSIIIHMFGVACSSFNIPPKIPTNSWWVLSILSMWSSGIYVKYENFIFILKNEFIYANSLYKCHEFYRLDRLPCMEHTSKLTIIYINLEEKYGKLWIFRIN